MGDKITGTVIMEKRDIRFPDGRVAVLVFGILGMSEEDANAYCRDRPEQSWVQGTAGAGIMRLGIAEAHTILPIGQDGDPEGQEGLMRYYAEQRIDSLVTAPIWRV